MHASMAAARRTAPIYWYESPNLTTGVWVLSKWEHCREVANSPELFINGKGFLIGDASDPATVIDQLPQWAQEQLRRPDLLAADKRGVIVRGKLSFGQPDLENMAFLDRRRHEQVRSVFIGALKPSRVRGLRPRIAEIADEYLDQIEPGAEIDFVKMAQRFRDYIDELLAERRANGGKGEDLVSVIARSQLDGGPVPHPTAVAFVTHFINAGETTRALHSHIAMALGQRPDGGGLLLERSELVQSAVEETMRYYPINWTQCRTGTERTEVAGQVVQKDDYLLLAYAGANRDEDVYEHPEDYDITHRSRRIISAGATASTRVPARYSRERTRGRSASGSSSASATGSWPASRRRSAPRSSGA